MADCRECFSRPDAELLDLSIASFPGSCFSAFASETLQLMAGGMFDIAAAARRHFFVQRGVGWQVVGERAHLDNQLSGEGVAGDVEYFSQIFSLSLLSTTPLSLGD